MKNNNTYLDKNIRIPGNTNIVIFFLAFTLASFILWACSHFEGLLIKTLCFVAFGLIGNTLFSLLHEAVHSNFHSNTTLNYIFGNICAALFPTGFSFQKRCHLNHHRQNRTDYEMFETYHEHDSKLLKTVMLYFILTGVYWLSPPIGSLWLMVSPTSLITSAWSGKENYKLGRMGGAGMLRNLERLKPSELRIIRLEIFFSLVFQVTLFLLLDLSLIGWVICYAGFALQWSSLQYADHAYSPRDIRNGAWNLQVSKFTRLCYLNYHHHLAHHQHPHVPWIHLEKFIDPMEERKSFWNIYLKMWRGLIKEHSPSPSAIDKNFERYIDNKR